MKKCVFSTIRLSYPSLEFKEKNKKKITKIKSSFLKYRFYYKYLSTTGFISEKLYAP